MSCKVKSFLLAQSGQLTLEQLFVYIIFFYGKNQSAVSTNKRFHGFLLRSYKNNSIIFIIIDVKTEENNSVSQLLIFKWKIKYKIQNK